MDFNLKKSIDVLERTPLVFKTLLGGIAKDWVKIMKGEKAGHLTI